MLNIVSNIKLPWLIFTLVIFSGLMKLGLWQSDRAIEKEQRLTRIVELNNKAPLSLNNLIELTDKNDENINDFPVLIDGQFVPEILFLLDNQPNKGRLGYRILQVVHSQSSYVLINLGWVPGSINRQELPDVAPLTGKIQFRGNVRLVDKGIMLMEQIFDSNQWPLRVQQIELDKFSTLIGHQLLPFVVYLDKNEAIGYEKNWQPVVMPPEKHSGYAFQWFSLAIAWLVLMVWASIKNNKNKNKKAKEV